MNNFAPQVVILSGNKSRMGFTYGELMADKLRQVYNILFQFYVVERQIPLKALLEKAEIFYRKYPPSYQKFLQAEAKGANLTLDIINIINGMETLNSLSGCKSETEDSSTVFTSDSLLGNNNILQGELSGCAFISVPAVKTTSGGNLIGRNYDFFAPFDQMAKYLTVTILHEAHQLPTAFVGFAGQIFCATCINREGIFVEFNNGMPSGGFETDHSVESLLIHLLQITQASTSFEQFDSQISTIRADYSLVVNVANRTHTKAFEFSAGQKILRKTNFTEGIIIASANSFSHPEWEIKPTDEECWFGHSRRDNLASQAEQRAILSVQDLKDVLDIHLDQGGGKWDYTLYQVILDTAGMQLFVKPTAVSNDWCAVDLSIALSDNFAHQLSGEAEAVYCPVIVI